eukprot:TRINITY_DN9780_c0_g1_i1.p1 TRINITY_DN9780_c0_g1~~TRINITY_DN9780_c0_g1_i1.p1  ORF type:complete len:641 (+),score=109.77 TRINITY_DN9780_c0_g1_i1:215-2137(+)
MISLIWMFYSACAGNHENTSHSEATPLRHMRWAGREAAAPAPTLEVVCIPFVSVFCAFQCSRRKRGIESNTAYAILGNRVCCLKAGGTDSMKIDVDGQSRSPANALAQTIGASLSSQGATVPVIKVANGGKLAKLKGLKNRHQRTLILLCIVCFIEGADMQLLPATFRALEQDLGFSPVLLGQMSLAQSLFQAAASPIWGALADRHSRKKLLTFSCVAWGVLTLLLASSTTITGMFVLRCLHGSTLSSLGPIAQSVTADVTEPSRRGLAYGLCAFSISAGQIVAALFGTSFGETVVAEGIRGWRVVFGFVSVISVSTAFLINSFMDELPTAASYMQNGDVEDATLSRSQRCWNVCGHEARRMGELFRIPSFVALASQGIFGTVPWNAMGFLTMYLQYCGHGNGMAAFIASGVLVGRAAGAILGGYAGDVLTKFSPAHGRPALAQVSVLLGVPLVFSLVELAPVASSELLLLNALVLGLVSSWCGAGVNRPILAEIVNPAGRASIVAWLTAIEGSSAALLGAPVVGLLAESAFGYSQLEPEVPGLRAEWRKTNMKALGRAMLWGTTPPWLICAAVYTVLHFTYAKDAENARQRYKMLVVDSDEELAPAVDKEGKRLDHLPVDDVEAEDMITLDDKPGLNQR